MSDSSKYLEPVDDDLPMRSSNAYAVDKLYALEAYIKMAQTAMKYQNWSSRNYIDLEAGPGKNRIGDQVYLGSPLIALTKPDPFDRYWFNELEDEPFEALQTRISHYPRKHRVKLLQLDANEAVDLIVNKIIQEDQFAASQGTRPSFNIAFLDPLGLEVQWQTVEKLGRIKKMDLIINFSTSAINRNLHQPEVIDRYFGNQSWRQFINIGDHVQRRRKMIDLYLEQLKQLGYWILNDDELGYHDISMKNTRNAEVYSLIFASKNKLGDKLWRQVKTEIDRLRHGSNRLL